MSSRHDPEAESLCHHIDTFSAVDESALVGDTSSTEGGKGFQGGDGSRLEPAWSGSAPVSPDPGSEGDIRLVLPPRGTGDQG
jgi:hypothetical protein